MKYFFRVFQNPMKSHQFYEGEEIISAEIGEREGVQPQLQLLLPLDSKIQKILKNMAWIEFLQENKNLFWGQIEKWNLNRFKGVILVIALARHPTNHEEQKQLCSTIKLSHTWEPRFGEDEGAMKMSRYLSTTLELPFWCRRTGKFSSSNLFEGRRTIKLFSHDILEGQYKSERAHNPLGAVEITLKCKWTQYISGSINLTPYLRSTLPGGCISTLTPQSIVQAWKDIGKKLQGSALFVVEADATIKRKKLGPSIWVKTDAMYNAKKVLLLIYEVEPQLILGWKLNVHREEIFTCRLEHNYQGKGASENSDIKTLILDLGDLQTYQQASPWQSYKFYNIGEFIEFEGQYYVCMHPHTSGGEFLVERIHWLAISKELFHSRQQNRKGFFRTDEGIRAIAHSLAMARGYLAFSARCERICFEIPFEKAPDIDCDATIVLEDHFINPQPIRGKVSSYKIVINPALGKNSIFVEMISAIGLPIELTGEGPKQSYGFEAFAYDDTAILELPELPSYQGIVEESPLDRFAGDPQFSGADILQDMAVRFQASEQVNFLQSQAYPITSDPFQPLSHKLTELNITLKDIGSQPFVRRVLKGQCMSSWSAPQQIFLTEVEV